MTTAQPGQEQRMENPAPDAAPSPMTTGEFHTASVSATDRFARPTADLGEDGELELRLGYIAFTDANKSVAETAAQARDRLILFREALADAREFIWNARHIDNKDDPVDVCDSCEIVRRLDAVLSRSGL